MLGQCRDRLGPSDQPRRQRDAQLRRELLRCQRLGRWSRRPRRGRRGGRGEAAGAASGAEAAQAVSHGGPAEGELGGVAAAAEAPGRHALAALAPTLAALAEADVLLHRLVDHRPIRDVVAQKLDDGPRVDGVQDEVVREELHEVLQLLRLGDGLLRLLHARLLPELLDERGAATVVKRVDDLDAQRLHAFSDVIWVLQLRRQHRLCLVLCLQLLIRVQNAQGARLDQDVESALSVGDQLEHVRMALQNVEQLLVLEVVVLLDPRHLEVEAELGHRCVLATVLLRRVQEGAGHLLFQALLAFFHRRQRRGPHQVHVQASLVHAGRRLRGRLRLFLLGRCG
mmetsp:Transcript_92407/g.258233  ORF Transcript_92407/g.258233 Transcript_92407/m.258233 type:complete len:340 (-) Transcript_92407:793-1812(-)